MDQVAAAQFANYMGRAYQMLAQQVGDKLHAQIGNIPGDQLSILSQDQVRLISYSNTFFSLSDSIAFQGADVYVKKVQDATAAVNDALKNIQEMNKVISISANFITLAGGLVSQNTSLITTALNALKDQIGL